MMGYGRTVILTTGLLLTCNGSVLAQNFGSNLYADSTSLFLHGGNPYWQFNPGQPVATALAPNSAKDFVMLASPNAMPGFVGYGTLVPLSNFASAQDLAMATQTFNAGLAKVNAGIADQARKSAELSAVAAAFTIIPPNPGDRFSLALSGAGWDGYAAGSISGAYRLNSQTLLFGGYSTSISQHMAKAGAAFSFR